MKKRQFSLTKHIWLMIMLATMIFAAIFGAIIYHVSYKEAQEQLLQEHRQLAQTPEALRWMANSDDTLHWLLATDGQSLFLQRYGNRHEFEQLPEQWLAAQLDESMQEATFKLHHQQLLITYLPQQEQYLISTLDQPIVQMLGPLLGLMVIFLFLGAAHSIMATGYVVKPIYQLSAYAQHIAARQWQEPIDSSASAVEIGQLIDAMNHMQQQLKQNDDEQQAFLQSISHDLKTPVAVIIGHAQAIIDGIYVHSAEHNAQIIVDEALRLEDKIKKILYYNTLDYSLANDPQDTDVDIPQLLHDLAARFSALTPELTWHIDTSPVQGAADEENLRVALENILDNALRYAHSQITLHNTTACGRITITIANDGEPIEPERLERIFDQLSKGPNGNFGLGLFISRKIITHYGGTITADNTADGVQFIITLPQSTH